MTRKNAKKDGAAERMPQEPASAPDVLGDLDPTEDSADQVRGGKVAPQDFNFTSKPDKTSP